MEGGKDYIIDKKWDLDSDGRINLSNVYHLNNGVDLEVFETNKQEYKLNDKDLNDPGTFKVIYTGSIRHVNNVKKFVDTAMILKEIDDSIIFLIYGAGNQKEELEEYCKENNLNIVIFKGHIEKKFIPYILSNGDLNVIHSKKSSVSNYGASLNKLFDYFASGKPIISDCIFGYDLINRYDAGISFDDDSVDTLAHKILYFRNLDKEEYQIYCENALRAAKDFDFKVLTKRLVEIIKNEPKQE